MVHGERDSGSPDEECRGALPSPDHVVGAGAKVTIDSHASATPRRAQRPDARLYTSILLRSFLIPAATCQPFARGGFNPCSFVRLEKPAKESEGHGAALGLDSNIMHHASPPFWGSVRLPAHLDRHQPRAILCPQNILQFSSFPASVLYATAFSSPSKEISFLSPRSLLAVC